MTLFGYRIRLEKIDEAKELERAKEVLELHGFRPVRKTIDKSKKSQSAKEATAIRMERAKTKVEEAIAKLNAEGKKINIANVVRIAGVSRITAKKYIDTLQKNKYNY